MTGIYKISSKCKPERFYIGSACDINNRWAVHRKDLRKNKHASIQFQRHVNKYGFNDIEFLILEECSREVLLEREQYYLDNLHPFFNTCKIAGSPMSNRKHSKESKDKMSKSHIGLNTWTKGRKLTEEHKRKVGVSMSRVLKGKKHSKQHNINNGLARRIPILQFDKQMNFIKEWDSATTASKELKLDNKNIGSCCRGKYGCKTVGGFIWKYKNKIT